MFMAFSIFIYLWKYKHFDMNKFITAAFCIFAMVACTNNHNNKGGIAKDVDNVAVTSDNESNLEISRKPGATQGTDSQTVTPVFVLANNNGSKFLLRSHNEIIPAEAPDGLKKYGFILFEGAYYGVKLKGYQSGSGADNGRDTPFNFDNREGWLYEMQEGKLLNGHIDEWNVFWGRPLLVDEHFMNTTELVKIVKPKASDNSKFNELKAKFEKHYGRKTIKFKVESYVGDYTYIIMQFETIKNKALGVVALVKPDGGTAIQEFSAEWDEFSVWREGDEGDFYGLDIDFATIEQGVLNLYTINNGEEGVDYQNYMVQGDSLVKGSVSNYFYHAPE